MIGSRRRFLRSVVTGAAGLGAVAVLAACGDEAAPVEAAAPGATEAVAADEQAGEAMVAETATAEAMAAATPTAEAIAAETPTGKAMAADAEMSGGVVLSLIQFGDDVFARITNQGASAQDLNGWQLCVQPAYWRFPARTLASGQSLEIEFGTGTDTDARVFTGGRIGPPDPALGNLALYRGGNFSNPADLVHFVQWGSGGLGRASVAVAADIWTAGEFVEAGPLASGGKLEYAGIGTGAAAWTARAG